MREKIHEVLNDHITILKTVDGSIKVIRQDELSRISEELENLLQDTVAVE